jgi:hypothetical protein
LFLILAQQPAAMKEKQPPAWTTEWLAKRIEKEEKKAARTAAATAPSDPDAEAKLAAAAEKRAASREAKVTEGLEDMGLWLEDLVRGGFATLPGRASSFWETPAARLVDAQAPGLARRVRRLDGITTTGERWPTLLLREAALLHLAREGWSRIATLPAASQADLRAAIGFVTSQEEVLAQTAVRDQWLVAAQCIEEEDGLRVQRTWMFGVGSGRPALCLSFSAAPNQPLDVSLLPGTTIDAELTFFPSAWPLRALVKQRHGAPRNTVPELPHATILAASVFAAEAFTANPWLERLPLALASVTPQRRTHGWIIRDAPGHCLPLETPESKAWSLVAVSGGRPIALAGEWDGEVFRPLSAWAEGKFLRV